MKRNKLGRTLDEVSSDINIKNILLRKGRLPQITLPDIRLSDVSTLIILNSVNTIYFTDRMYLELNNLI